MKYNIIEDPTTGFRIEGSNDGGVIFLEQPFNSFTGKLFDSKEECQEYCTTLGYIDTPDINSTPTIAP